MEVVVDPDVKEVVEFMQEKIEARKLIGAAEGLRAIAPILRGRHERHPVQTIELHAEPITCGSPPVANGSALVQPHVGDDF